jgi:hypothetical protein
MAFGKVCPACGAFVDAGGKCDCGGQRSDGRVPDARRLALEAVWNSARWKALSRLIRRRDGKCVECGGPAEVADHDEGFDGPDDPRAWDETKIHAMCLRCSGSKDGAKPRLRS